MEAPAGIRQAVRLAPFTTYKIGGPADLFFEATSKEELADAVRYARSASLPYFILGTGANILMSDKGFRGLVILNRAATVSFEGDRVRAESGATIADLIEMTANRDLSGLEHFAGIPSTVGGAIWQNLHFLSPDRERTVFIAEVLEEATILDGENTVRAVPTSFFEFGYDDSILHREKDLVVLEAVFRLKEWPADLIREQAAANRSWRREKQPQLEEFPSCGSVFKKIEGAGAGRLIDQVGLKGHAIGGAMISPKHANFFVNTGNATAADVKALIKLAHDEVLAKTGYDLETEISFIGEE